MQHILYGKKCEAIACKFLKDKGYKIIKKNYSNMIGEIDIIAKDKDCLVFVEVKARFSSAFGDPLEAIDEEKQNKIRMVATFYLKKKHLLDAKCRFDAVAILGDGDYEIRHVENAF